MFYLGVPEYNLGVPHNIKAFTFSVITSQKLRWGCNGLLKKY